MLILGIAAGGGLLAYALTILLFARPGKWRIRARMDAMARDADLENVHDAVLSEKRQEKKNKRKSRLISERFEDNLAMSGIRISAQEYILLWGGTTMGPILLGFLLGAQPVAILGLAIIGFAVPPVLVQRSRSQRQQLFNKQLSDALTIMSNCMRSGYSFQQAMASIAQEMQPPISAEFARVVREIQYGATMEQALTSMVARVKNKDLELLVSAVLTSAQVGANLSEILDTIAETVRDRIRMREEVRVLSAQGRMSGMIIGLLPVAVILILMVMNPTYFGAFVETSTGKMLMILCVAMECTGFFVINRIVDIRY